MVYILDSDHLSILEWGGPDSMTLRERLADLSAPMVVSTIVNYEEQIRGWMTFIAKARSIPQQVAGYQRLRRHLENYRHINVLDFDEAAARHYQQFRDDSIRVGAMYLKIAAIALSLDATLLSRNQVDFGKVPGLRVEDWTQ